MNQMSERQQHKSYMLVYKLPYDLDFLPYCNWIESSLFGSHLKTTDFLVRVVEVPARQSMLI